MRLPLAVGASLLISMGLTTPVFSRPPIRVTQTRPSKSDLQQLRVNQRLWNKQNITNYRYTLTRSCFCIAEAREPVIVEVRNGETVSVTSAATGQPVDPELFKQYDTIPELFKVIQDAIARKADKLDIQYAPQLGHPTQINIDYSFQLADEELFITVENFQAL